ncbi:hypothetical protein HU811_06015 [Pseudomonas sp. SWRI196]|uniref:Lipoprotein n=1 Tax=Pseudomonas tehranensis TaxID=2745502 RepID=A0ABR6UNU3_9PSED|nr:hypothetical protein [Pseudomonas tehranensis]MBC3346187.1 hypothetical protein [Pseudomonas tehranensis]
MNKIICSIIVCSSISGCSIKSAGPYSESGWSTLSPPQADALGASILEFKGNNHLGDYVKRVKPNQIEYRDSLSSYSQTDVSNFKGGLDLTIKGISADLNYETDGSSSKIANNLKVSKVKEATMVNEENRWFVYQCLIAGSYEFSARKKSSTNIGIDAAQSEWAKALGMEKASIGISSNPTSPDELKIKVDKPNVCLSYIAAKFEPNEPFFSFMRPKTSYITGGQETEEYPSSFTLRPGQESRERTADIKNRKSSSKTLYRLKVTKSESDTLQLRVCKTPRGLSSIVEEEQNSSVSDPCSQILLEAGTGSWRGPYILGLEKPTEDDLVLITLNLDARTVTSDSISIKEPRINVSQFKIKYK